MIADAPMPVRLMLLVLICGVCGLLLVGVLGKEPLALKLALVDVVLLGGLFLFWRTRGGAK